MDVDALHVSGEFGDTAMTVDSPRPVWSDEDHERMDKGVADLLSDSTRNRFMQIHLRILFAIADNLAMELQDRELEAIDDTGMTQLLALLQEGKGEGYAHVRRHLVRLMIPEANTPRSSNSSSRDAEEEYMATEKSWKTTYQGGAVKALRLHIMEHWKKKKDKVLYAPYLSITQSSGCGKSRLADEFSKEHFSIPINVRKPNESGFPASDKALCAYFDGIKLDDRKTVLLHTDSFLISLFNVARRRVLARPPQDDRTPAQWFREAMTEGQTMERTNIFRADFYRDVVAEAAQVFSWLSSRPAPKPGSRKPPSPGRSGTDPEAVAEAARRLSYAVEGIEYNDADPPLKSAFPIIFIPVDEAHALLRYPKNAHPGTATATENVNMGSNDTESDFSWSLWSQLRRSLRVLLVDNVFAFFLSTTGSISQFNPTRAKESSARIANGLFSLIPPFCCLGFDQLAQDLPADVQFGHIASWEYQISLGRPLFAARWLALRNKSWHSILIKEYMLEFAQMKLTRFNASDLAKEELSLSTQLAILSHRIPIEFMSTVYPTTEETDQVANHMRICLSIGASLSSLVTLNSSEPSLSAAAADIMRLHDKFSLPDALSKVLSGFSIHVGDRGEFVHLGLTISARDRAMDAAKIDEDSESVIGVVPFLNHLLRTDVPVHVQWPNSTNSGPPCIDFWSLKPSFYRNNEDKEADLATAFREVKLHFSHFIKRDVINRLDINTLVALLARNAAVLGANCQPAYDALFITVRGDLSTVLTNDTVGIIMSQVKLDRKIGFPIRRELFTAMDPQVLGFTNLNVPIIRMVFALAGTREGISVVEGQTQANFTSYDIWVSGLSHQVYSAIDENQESEWKKLLNHGASDKYKNGSQLVSDMLKSMNPGASDEEPFLDFLKRRPQSDVNSSS